MIFCSFEATEKESEKNVVIESQTREWKKEETTSSEEKIHNYARRKHKFDYFLKQKCEKLKKEVKYVTEKKDASHSGQNIEKCCFRLLVYKDMQD